MHLAQLSTLCRTSRLAAPPAEVRHCQLLSVRRACFANHTHLLPRPLRLTNASGATRHRPETNRDEGPHFQPAASALSSASKQAGGGCRWPEMTPNRKWSHPAPMSHDRRRDWLETQSVRAHRARVFSTSGGPARGPLGGGRSALRQAMPTPPMFAQVRALRGRARAQCWATAFTHALCSSAQSLPRPPNVPKRVARGCCGRIQEAPHKRNKEPRSHERGRCCPKLRAARGRRGAERTQGTSARESEQTPLRTSGRAEGAAK